MTASSHINSSRFQFYIDEHGYHGNYGLAVGNPQPIEFRMTEKYEALGVEKLRDVVQRNKENDKTSCGLVPTKMNVKTGLPIQPKELKKTQATDPLINTSVEELLSNDEKAERLRRRRQLVNESARQAGKALRRARYNWSKKAEEIE